MDNGACSYRRFLDGDDMAFVEIIKTYKDGLTLYLYGFVGSLPLAEDLMRETFFKLLVKKPHFSQKSAFKTWLYAIGRNEALACLKKRARILDRPFEDCEEWLSAGGGELETGYLREERRIRLHRALGKLHPDYRQVLYLTYFEGFSHAQARAVMKKSKTQMENLMYRAKKALKAELLKEGFDDEDL